MEGALDALRARFGDAAIGKGLSLRAPQRPGATSRKPAAAEDPDA
jgi:DNA polymerase-4